MFYMRWCAVWTKISKQLDPLENECYGGWQGGSELEGGEGKLPSLRILQFIHTLQQQGPFIHNRPTITMGVEGSACSKGGRPTFTSEPGGRAATSLGPAHIQSAQTHTRKKKHTQQSNWRGDAGFLMAASSSSSLGVGAMTTLWCLDQTSITPPPQLGIEEQKWPWSICAKSLLPVWITMQPNTQPLQWALMGISFTSHITKDTDSIHADLGPSACDSCLKKK